MSLPNNTPLTEAEIVRFVELLRKPRRSNSLTSAESTEFDELARRSKIPVIYPNMPPWIIIPITHQEQFIAGDPGVGGPVV